MKKHTCRWWDCHMDCCRHPKYYEQMRIRGVFFEPICDEKSDRCEYEKIDEQHPSWCGEDYEQ